MQKSVASMGDDICEDVFIFGFLQVSNNLLLSSSHEKGQKGFASGDFELWNLRLLSSHVSILNQYKMQIKELEWSNNVNFIETKKQKSSLKTLLVNG